MLDPGCAKLWVHFFPIGNTPAVSLTQGLPPEKKADILLLGCGDIRNILFTLHCDSPRQFDITCCDVESTVIARNILLLTLILDDEDGQKGSDNWDIYYHVYLNKTCHDRLLEQAKKLHVLAASLEAWRASEYGKLFRICDKGTLVRIANVWAFLISAATERQSWMKQSFKTAIAARKLRRPGNSFTHNGLRSVTPVGSLAAPDIEGLNDHFWDHGSLHLDDAARSHTTFPNPMFVSPDATVRLHYGIDPLIGFHSSTAYVPLKPGSPLSHGISEKPKLADVVAVAKTEFFAWCGTFRERAQGFMVLRVFVGDALAFCYTL